MGLSSSDGARHVTDQLGCDMGHRGKLDANTKRCKTQMDGIQLCYRSPKARDIYRE